jgi:hypothetical protein
MIDWNLVSSILEDLQKIARPEFDDDEKICWMLEQTWELAQKAERKACMGICEEAAEDMTDMAKWGAQTCSKLIKARGQA